MTYYQPDQDWAERQERLERNRDMIKKHREDVSSASSQPSFAERVAEVDRRAIEAKRCGAVANQTDTQTVLDLLACIREQRAALDSALDRIEEGLESEGRMEADWSKDDRAFISETRAVLARWRIEK